MDRRELLKGVGAVGAMIFGAGAVSVASEAGKTAGLPSCGTDFAAEAAAQAAEEAELTAWVTDEVQELERFAERGAALTGLNVVPQGISLPFASTPMSFYTRLDQKHYDLIPTPKIPTLEDHLWSGQGGGLEHPLRLLFARQLNRLNLPKELQLVSEIPRRVPHIIKEVPVRADRIVSPRFVIDIDEPDCKGYSRSHLAAAMLLGMVYGAAAEMESRWLAAVQAVADSPGAKDVPCSVYFAYRGPEVWAEKKAYMLEIFFHVLTAGIIYPV